MSTRPSVRLDYGAQATVGPVRFAEVMERYRAESDVAVAGLSGATGLVFDERSGQCLDVWGARPGESRPVVVAVHGGYWRMLSRHDTAFMAAALAEVGIATVTVDYRLAPANPIEEIVREVRSAIAWVHHRGAAHGLDPARVVVVGSSAGAHLAAMTIVGGWQREYDLPEDPAQTVAGAMLLSGLYDLRPLVGTAADEWLRLTPERAWASSPIAAPRSTVPVVVADAALEASGFHHQTELFASHWQAGADTRVRQIADRDHFDVFLDLADPRSLLFRELLALGEGTSPLPRTDEAR